MMRMKTETKRKIAGIIAGLLAFIMLLSTVSVITGLAGATQNIQTTQTTTVVAE